MQLGPIMLDIEGTTLTQEDRELIAHPLVGGLIYFSRNYQSVEQITQLSADIRSIRPDILIAVDQEGGRVQRFKEGFTRLPAMQRFLPLYKKNPIAAMTLVEDCGWLMAAELLAVGVDFSFAPVLDVDDQQCEVIADRAFSNDPKEVAALAGAFMRGMRSAGMATTGKHFPGHGSVTEDSHLALPCDDREYTQVEQHDLIPFEQLAQDLDAIMPAHIIFPKIDSSAVGFSSYWLQQVLRQQLKFNGVIFSDDLTMEGATVAGSYGERAQAALNAGCDMVLVCNSRAGVKEVMATLTEQAKPVALSERLNNMQGKPHFDVQALALQPRFSKVQVILAAMSAQ